MFMLFLFIYVIQLFIGILEIIRMIYQNIRGYDKNSVILTMYSALFFAQYVNLKDAECDK